MWASDWPHLERDLIAGFMRYEMDETLRRKILGENALALLWVDTARK